MSDQIEDYEFSDEDVKLREAYSDRILLDCSMADGYGMQYIDVSIEDVEAMAKHFNLLITKDKDNE